MNDQALQNRLSSENIISVWRARINYRQSLCSIFGSGPAERTRYFEEDLGLCYGVLQREMNKPFWER